MQSTECQNAPHDVQSACACSIAGARRLAQYPNQSMVGVEVDNATQVQRRYERAGRPKRCRRQVLYPAACCSGIVEIKVLLVQ